MISRRKAGTLYAKAIRVVNSCTTLHQLEGARKYVNNYFRVCGEVENWHPLVIDAPSYAVSFYNHLIQRLEEKENILSDEI